MNKKTSFLLRNLSAAALVTVYLCLVVMHFINDGFIPENQLGLIITMFPFILMGVALDLLLKRNAQLGSGMRIVAQLLPLGIFILQIVSTIFIYIGKESYEVFNYLIWIFISLPFFITSYEKDDMRPRVIRSLYGTGAVIVVYVFLLTQTRELTYGIGEMIYFIFYFLVLYMVSGNKKLPYLGTIIGIVNAVVLLLTRYFPFTENARSYGWDYDIAFIMELLVLSTFILCVVIRLLEEIMFKKTVNHN